MLCQETGVIPRGSHTDALNVGSDFLGESTLVGEKWKCKIHYVST